LVTLSARLMVTRIEARRAEIARRYRAKRRARPISMAALRIAELRRLFKARYGDELPDDDAGRADAALMAHHLARRPGDPHRRIALWLVQHAPWMPADERERLADDAIAKPLRWKADTLAARLNLTAGERQRLRICTIGSTDRTKAERLADRKQRKREADRLRRQQHRQAKGAKPRTEYETNSRARMKPWLTAGVSRSTWYRRARLAA
jgi:hypothetical protein